MHLKWLVVISLLLFVIPFAAFADPILFGGHGGFHFGGAYFDYSGINDYLDPAGMDTLPSVIPTIGGGGQAIIFGGIVIGARGSGSQYHLSGNSVDVDASSSFGFIDVGYAVINTKRWLLEPVAGVGGSSMRLRVDGQLNNLGLQSHSSKYNSRTPDKDISDKLTMSTNSTVGHVGLIAYHQVPFAQGENGGFGMFLVGLSAGWIYEINHNGWEIEGENVPNGPDFKPNAGYIQLEFHFGGGSTRVSEKESDSQADAKSKDDPPLVNDPKTETTHPDENSDK